MGYTLLEVEKVTETLRKKPKWVTCLSFTAAVLFIIASAISVGVIIGYSYCYFEYRSGMRSGNLTQSANFQIVHMPISESEEVMKNRTINGALKSSVLIQRILNIGHTLMEEELPYVPWGNEESSVLRFT